MIPLLTLIFLSCSSKSKKGFWPALDEFVEEKKKIVWARTHFPVSPVKQLNQARQNRVRTFMRQVCPSPTTFSVIREYNTDSESLQLNREYTPPRQVTVVEFKCHKK